MEMVISRKYEVLGQLGQGGMGVVYKVRHSALDTTLALKVLPRDLMANPEMVTRFYREARVMARLRHPNIIRVLDIDHDEALGFHYFVMEHIQGKTLRQHLQEQGPLPLPDLLTIATQVARALVYAHAHKPPVIHRDIKPANIMIEDGSSRVVVMDFGIAKELGDGEMTQSGVVLGTLKYCSPEQLRHEPLDGGADVYALGMVLYEAYAGTQFFAGLDEAAVIGKVLYEPGENEPHFTRPTPSAFTALVTKAIAKSRERRYRRMEDALHDIESCFATLDEVGTVVLPAPRREEAPPEQSEIEDLDAQIRKLETERQRRFAVAARAQAQAAREKANAAGAGQFAAHLLQQGAAQEELGHAQFQGNNYSAAYEAYQAALGFFTQAYHEASAIAAMQQATHVRGAMQNAKAEAEHAGARDKARTFYRRALAIQSQADERWEEHAYQQAVELYSEARALFDDAQDLASRETLRVRTEAVKTRMLSAKEVAVAEAAEEFARTAFLQAVETERQADAALRQEEFARGEELYTLAQQAYERAAHAAAPIRQQREAEKGRQEKDLVQPANARREEEDSGSLAWTGLPETTPSVGDARGPHTAGTPSVRESDDGQWEIGERAAGREPRPITPAPLPRRSRTPWLMLSGIAVLALVLVGWFGRSLLQPPAAPPQPKIAPVAPPAPPPQPVLPPLTLAQVEPREATITTTEGETVAFAVQASSAESLRYEWTIDGKPMAQERQWSYRPLPGDGGSAAKVVRVVVTDQHGQRVEREWRMTVAAANQPPRITAATPTNDALDLVSGATQTFGLEVKDPENGKLRYEWIVDGKTVSVQPSFTWKAQGEGKRLIRAVVRDQGGLSTAQEWQVAVVTPPPATPAPPLPPPTQKNAAPRITQRLPADRAVTAREGETLEFSALALDPDNEEVFYHWSVDGKRTAQGDRFSYSAAAAGKHRVELEAADKSGLKDVFRWEIQVETPPAAPRIVMYTPYREKMRLYSHLSRFFGVEVQVAGMAEPPIRYEWKIDGRRAAGQELLEFKNQEPGRHEVEVTATGPSGDSIVHKWTIDVQDRQEADASGPVGPPHLEMSALDNDLSADKKQVIVKGSLRNVGDHDAENVIIWISALDAQQGTVSRRLALPMPQPLAPGQSATFHTAFGNRDEIADFRVEIVSK
jgi:hypothetical protein